jgi:MFS family permease
MRNPLRTTFADLGTSFSRVRGNARVIVLSQPFWFIPYSMFFPYLTQYMLALGLKNEQVGLINAISMVVGVVLSLFAGWVTDRLGRRVTTVIADLLSWTLAAALWALAHNFAWFVAAAVANSFVRIVSVSWNCCVVEDTPPENRINIFWWLNIIGTLSALFTPLMALFIGSGDNASLIHAMRIVLGGTAVIYAVSFLVRFYYMRETTVGQQRMASSRGTSPLTALGEYPRLFARVLANPLLLCFLLIRTLFFVHNGIKGTYLSVAVVQGLGFGQDAIGLINLGAGLVMLVSQFLLLPRLQTISPRKPLMISLGALLLSYLLLVVSPQHSALVLLAYIVVSAGGGLVTGMLVDMLTANAMPDHDRSALLGVMSILVVAISAPFQYLCGWLADLPGLGPRLPMLTIVALFAVSMALLSGSGLGAKKLQAEG